MTRLDTVRELALPLPWLILSLVLYASPIWPAGAIASFMFFLCALRLNHEAIHGNLGLSRRGDGAVMHGLSAIMGGSNHAVAHGHMVHHAHVMGPDDFEGRCGHMTLGQVLCYGPRFPFDIARAAWTSGRPQLRRRIILDWSLFIALCIGAILTGLDPLVFHVAVMIVAQCLTALFAVWITHQRVETGAAARSQRGPLARLAYLMFYHREHHLFPKVPVRHLPRLADRLDAIPAYAAKRVPVVAIFDRVSS